ncbi:MAG: toll/interleukin-1 receptor domain-containing protein [Pedosphaera sp.]|nr:toll/interleukin-1 receptor domain-containing protein [Pedosphaera sp.]
MNPSQDSASVCILFKPRTQPDEDLARILARELRSRGHHVSLDERTTAGLAWAEQLAARIQKADLVIPLVSARSAESEMLAYEVELVTQAAHEQGGLPQLMPVRLHFSGPLPDQLGNLLQPSEFAWDDETDRYKSHRVLWNSPADDVALIDLIGKRISAIKSEQKRSNSPTQFDASARSKSIPLDPVGGAMSLESKYYIVRPTDPEFHSAVRRGDSLVLVKGARQMGKTSLLGRAVQQAREAGASVVLTDFQKLQARHFASIKDFYIGLCDLIGTQLRTEPPAPERWEKSQNVNRIFEEFWRHEVFGKKDRPVLWVCDEFDRLFTTSFGTEVCGLLRSWHNERALDSSGPWRFLTVAIAYATEAHLFINDLNQSPFNVGTRVTLNDFSRSETSELNGLYRGPLKNDAELDRFHRLLGGQPYLTQLGLRELAARNAGIQWIEEQAHLEETIFSDHLLRLLAVLNQDEKMMEAIRPLARNGTQVPADIFYRLRSAGVIVGHAADQVRLRCDLYRQFLGRHLS